MTSSREPVTMASITSELLPACIPKLAGMTGRPIPGMTGSPGDLRPGDVGEIPTQPRRRRDLEPGPGLSHRDARGRDQGHPMIPQAQDSRYWSVRPAWKLRTIAHPARKKKLRTTCSMPSSKRKPDIAQASRARRRHRALPPTWPVAEPVTSWAATPTTDPRPTGRCRGHRVRDQIAELGPVAAGPRARSGGEATRPAFVIGTSSHGGRSASTTSCAAPATRATGQPTSPAWTIR